ncbi:hypothetical protein EVG20_g10711 [Dentipellis fragilis]|uniref:peptidylprolyl isomerase n=1 Tax=Dentipellis fragilis TaxID=205917 RepID=A0A4Y9XU61_9AGAM|nr:hypothetical protein EVG20_g10711 [Dentipellis fragilis]
MVQGGDITARDGTGGRSIYGPKFEGPSRSPARARAHESFAIPHDRPGLLSMANRGPGTNSSQVRPRIRFFITTAPAPWCDGKNVVFGEVVEGLEVVRRIQGFMSDHILRKPSVDVRIRTITIVTRTRTICHSPHLTSARLLALALALTHLFTHAYRPLHTLPRICLPFSLPVSLCLSVSVSPPRICPPNQSPACYLRSALSLSVAPSRLSFRPPSLALSLYISASISDLVSVFVFVSVFALVSPDRIDIRARQNLPIRIRPTPLL